MAKPVAMMSEWLTGGSVKNEPRKVMFARMLKASDVLPLVRVIG